ncbi:hypothetical protein FBT53_03565 [Flavobacterium sp. ASW18X]|nr:hypothetical protein FBT53_03565 [Flavobacterium sp. ASW18X]
MKMKLFYLFVLLFGMMLSAQEKATGPIISEFGAVYKISNPDFKTNVESEFKVVFDVYSSPKDPNMLNRSIETAARFLNMHSQAGVPAEQLHVALVVHGKAALDVLVSTAYKKRNAVDNPNEPLLHDLLSNKVSVILCGQSANGRGIEKSELIPGVQLALSAMTALIQLQNQGYQLIKF